MLNIIVHAEGRYIVVEIEVLEIDGAIKKISTKHVMVIFLFSMKRQNREHAIIYEKSNRHLTSQRVEYIYVVT